MKELKIIDHIQYFTFSSDNYLVLLHRDHHTIEIIDVEKLESGWLYKSEDEICSMCFKHNQHLLYAVKYQEEGTTVYKTRMMDLNELEVCNSIDGIISRINSKGQFLINNFENNVSYNSCYAVDNLKMLWKLPHWEFGPTIFDNYLCWASKSKTEFGLVELLSGNNLWKIDISSLSVLSAGDTVLYVNWKNSKDFVFVPLESGGLLQIRVDTGEFIRHISTSVETGRFGSHEIDTDKRKIFKVLRNSILEMNFDTQEFIRHECRDILPDYFHHGVGSPVSQNDQSLFIYNSGKNKIFQIRKNDMKLEDTFQVQPGDANEGRRMFFTIVSNQNQLFSLDSSFTFRILSV